VRIVEARVIPVHLRFARPLRTARGEFAGRTSTVFELRDEDGLAGYGEAAPWPGFGMETVDEAAARLADVAGRLRWVELEPGEWSAGIDDLLGTSPAARAAVQGALWDLAARRAGRSLAEQLAGSVGSLRGAALRRVPVSVLLVQREPDALRQEAVGARTAGHLAVKLKLGAMSLAEDVARARAVREGLGPDIALRGDANGAWDAPLALKALEALAAFRFDYVEQPLAADESVALEAGALRLLEARAVDVVVLKPATLGGAARALEIAVRARQAGVQVVFSHAFESAVGARHVLHCAAAWADPDAVHGLCTAGLFASDVAPSMECEAGFIDVPEAPGLGLTL
jgi:L-alanine-DL-glutamate epimerase-like enolase superfamily enzyme